MRGLLENLCNSLEACIELRGGPKDGLVTGYRALDAIKRVRRNLATMTDAEYADAEQGRKDALNLHHTIGWILSATLATTGGDAMPTPEQPKPRKGSA